MKINWKALLISILIPLAVGALSAFLTQDSMADFAALTKPPLSPPGWLFPVVWTILYILMGIASYLALTAEPTVTVGTTPNDMGTGAGDPALRFYAAQLVFNFGWSLIFFNWEAYLLAFFWLVILWVLILITTILFYQRSRLAGLLMLPYLAWVTFAGYLNLGIWFLN